MNKTMPRLLVSTGVLLLMLMLAACAPNGTNTGNAPSDTATASSATNTPEATATTNTTPLPDDIPAYPGAKLSSNTDQSGVNTYLFTTSDNTTKVLNFYKEQMPAQGWSEKQQDTAPVANILEYTKGQQQVVITIVTPLPTSGSDQTQFSIAISG